ncbi:cyclic nucleotide-binding domain-containing protein [Desulforhopalus sp. 52FAK]
MNTSEEKYCDAVFVITEEKSCPVYNIGEELKIQNFCLSISSYKPGCLHLAKNIASILTVSDKKSKSSSVPGPQSKFDCGGCEGLIHFEYQREKDFATVQMKMMQDAEERRNRHLTEKYFKELKKLEIFKLFDDHSLVDLILLLEFKTILQNKRVVKKGASGHHLYIILKGKVAVIKDDGSRAVELEAGEIFGEMSLLSGEPVSKSIHTTEDTQVAMLSLKNFRDVLRSYHKLQFYLLKILTDRAQTVSLQLGEISSGMSGKLSDISVVDLFNIMNSKRKTGALHFSLKEGKAVAFFRDGEVIFSRFQRFRQEQSVTEILAAKVGSFHYMKGLPNELKKSSPIAPFDELMLDAMQSNKPING